MKPDFEETARATCDRACWNMLMFRLHDAYAAGYRDGQERMLGKFNAGSGVWAADMEIEEPPT